MKSLFLAAGVAALAISVPAAADRGGKGSEKRAQAAKVERGGGNARAAKADRQQARAGGRQKARSENRQKARSENRQKARAADRRQARSSNRQEARAADRRQSRAARAERGGGNPRAAQNRRAEKRQAERQNRARAERRQAARQNRIERDDRRVVRVNRDDRDGRRIAVRDDRRSVLRSRDFDRDRFERRFASRGFPASFGNGCPPGLAKQNELCMPPGQYKKLVGQRLPTAYASQRIPRSLRDLYRDTDDYYYRYGDGYAYRVDRDDQLIRSVLPLIGAGLGIGMPFPYSSPTYHVPTAYQSFYPDSPYSYHRYANGYVYEIDRNSGLIDDMIPFYGQSYGVGQMLPSSYSYYNVPYPYRSWYQDNDDYSYRYAPGAIYQVDRDTQLITAVASLLTGNNALAVGQPLPMGYDMYNVPYSYRDRYYDTPDSWYRYSNGYVYQVDPTTRLVTAIVDAIV